MVSYIAPPFAPTPRSPSDKKVDDVRLRRPFILLGCRANDYWRLFTHAQTSVTLMTQRLILLHIELCCICNLRRYCPIIKILKSLNIIIFILSFALLYPKLIVSQGNTGAAESTHGHWSAEIRPHHIQDFHWHSMTLSGLSRYTEEGDSSVRSRWRMMWSENHSVCGVINEVTTGGGKDSHVEERKSGNSPVGWLSAI